MNISEIILIVLGLSLFEVISSIDNAVVNADVLSTMSKRARRWFLLYGIIIAVFVVRGLMPLLIVYFSSPGLNLIEAFSATFSSDPSVMAIIKKQTPILLAGGGMYLVYLFFYWLFIETKEYAFFIEKFIYHKLSFWFYAAASIILLLVVWATIKINPLISFGAVVGSTAFFITNGFKKNAEEKEKQLLDPSMSAWSKIIYLEVLDASFSIDGVIGAFAFTLSIPLILLGNGLGAVVVREMTIKGLDYITKFEFLKNGAMYAIGVLGAVMISEAFGLEIPFWFPPLIMILMLGIFLYLSVVNNRAKIKLAKVVKK